VIGGMGSLWGSLIGGIVLGLAQSIGTALDPKWFLLAGHLTFLAVLAL
jgi:branched-chain amino acid transport system permease protein